MQRPSQTRPGDRARPLTARRGGARVAALTLLSLADTAAALLLPAALGHTLDLLLDGTDAGSAAGRRWSLLCAALVGAQIVLDAATTVLTATTDAREAARLRGRLLRHVLAVGPRAADRFPAGDLVTRGTVNAAHAGAEPAALAAAVSGVAAPAGGIVALALVDWRLAVAFAAGVPPLAVLLRTFTRSTADVVARYQEIQADIAGRLVEALGGARTIAAAGTEPRERDRVLAPLPELSAQGHRMWHVSARAVARAAALAPLLQLVVVAVAGLLLAVGDLTVGGLLAAARYVVMATGIGVFVGHLNRLVRARGAARRLGEVFAEPPVRHGDATLPPGGPGRLELRRVTARRDGRDVLRGLDLVLPGGATVAVVGRSGAGKSLLAALAGRLADPDDGDILLDGVPLAALPRATLRAEIGYAFERPALLGSTLAGTIGFGPAPPPADRIAAAARSASADTFIRRLPDGYATRCADAPLSGGELQRLGLARAFTHTGRLLILDDATSSLDTVTELRVGRALLADAHARTRLIVAHRAASAARADLVAWLDGGRIRALGPHRDLWRWAEYRAVWEAGDDAGEARDD
ncbi:ABC transporter ATP-binding protein [Streptomyces sp. NBC_01803]|uniref:ABC transporter ATP-binding protein n=1 Tax=Streptomyces sp. NBC_01803 TaxID=2975946 RepID=UPI002DD7FA69|nr:ABC transporter ATP-binding protein [Streptomyces sp. NBC_01803]WSA43390.1 ABC transporter ATP-binding protein/permease [Streptomyces sp. NBC_01803]